MIGIFNKINAHAFPAMHPAMHVAVQLKGDAFEHFSVQIALVGPEGGAPFRSWTEIDASDEGGAFIALGIAGARFPVPGTYTLSVLVGDRVLASHPILLRQLADTDSTSQQ